MVNRLKQRNRVLNGIHSHHDIFSGKTHLLCNFFDTGLLFRLRHQFFLYLQCLIRRIPQRSGNPNRIIVPKIPSYFPDDHGAEISRGHHIHRDIKIINCLDKSHHSDLEQIIHIFISIFKPFDDAEHQSQISFNKLLPCLLIPFSAFYKKRLCLCSRQNRKICRIDAADFHLTVISHPLTPFDQRFPITIACHRQKYTKQISPFDA